MNKILHQSLRDAQINVGRMRGSQKLSGYIVWNGFEDMDLPARQAHIRHMLEEALGANVQKVSTILTYTPDEYRRMSAVA